jgi:hypothetical protein
MTAYGGDVSSNLRCKKENTFKSTLTEDSAKLCFRSTWSNSNLFAGI